MSTEKDKSKDEDLTKRSGNIVSSVPAECLEDPRFVKVLATSLLSEISSLEQILNESDAEIKGLKENVAQGLEKRKVLKEFTQMYTNKNAVLNTAFESLERDAKNRSIEVEIVKNRLDDASLREIADRNQFKKLLDDYHEKWQKYKATYEEHPLAKERQKAYVTLKQLRAKLMMTEYEKHNLITMLKQRKKIDNMRVKVSIIEISKMVLQRWKDQEHIQNLKVIAKQLQDKLDACTSQLSQLEQEEEKKKRSKIESSMMPPPRLDFSFMRSICTEQGNYFKKRYPIQMRDLDSVSINTLMLEEMSKTPANDEVTELRRKNTQPFEEDEEQSLNFPNSISMIQEIEPIYPISKQNDKTSASELTTNQTDIQNKLKKLSINKKTTVVLNKNQQKQNTECSKDNNDENNDGIANERKNYELSIVESHQRTLRWCKESQDEFAPFLLSGQRSNSLNYQSKSNLSIVEANKSVVKKISKASSIHESDTKSLRQAEQDKKFKNGAPMEVAHKNERLIDQMGKQEQRKRPSGEKLRENIRIGVGTSQSREKEMQNEISSPTIATPANSQQIYETPKGTMLKQSDNNLTTRESIVSEDNSEIPIDASCSKPKIRKVETVNFPVGQRPKDTDVIRQCQPDISYSPKNYVPSCMSSNLSNNFEAALQEMPQGSLCGDNQGLSGFPSLTDWKNWSPPNSERSLASSISKIGQNKETNEQKNPQNQAAPFDYGGFFSMKPTQNANNIF